MKIICGILIQFSFSFLSLALILSLNDIAFDETLSQIWARDVQIISVCTEEPFENFLNPKSAEEYLDLNTEKPKGNYCTLVVLSLIAINIGGFLIYIFI